MTKKQLLKSLTVSSVLLATGAVGFSTTEVSADSRDDSTVATKTTVSEITTTATEEQVLASEQAVELAGETAQEAESEAVQAQSEADKVKAEADQAQAESDALNAKVEALQVGQSDVNIAQEAVVEAEKEVDVKSEAVMVAEQEVESAKSSDAELERQITEAKSAVAKQEAKVAESQSKVEEATIKALSAEKAVEVSEQEVESKKPSISYEIHNNLPQDIKDALKAMVEAKPEDVSSTRQKLTEVVSSYDYPAMEKLFNATIEGGEEIVDLDNPTDDQLKKMNQFYVDMLNSIRTSIGLDPVSVNSKLIEISKLKAKAYDETDEWDHNYNIINAAEMQVLEKKNVTDEQQAASNHYSTFNNDKSTQFLNLKQVYELLTMYVIMLNLHDEPSNWGHSYSQMKAHSLGMTFYHAETDQTDPARSIYTTYHDQSAIVEKYQPLNANVHEADITYTNDDSAYQTVFVKATIAKTAHKAAQAELADAKATLEAAQEAVKDAKSNYQYLSSIPRKTIEAETNLAKAQSELVKAKAKLESAKEVLIQLTASDAEKAQVLAEAKQEAKLAEAKALELHAEAVVAQSNAADAKAMSEAARNAVKVLKESLEEAKTKVEEAKAYHTSLLQAQSNLHWAQEAYDLAVATHKETEAKYVEEVAKLSEIKAAYDQAKAQYDRLKLQYELIQSETVTPDVPSETDKPELPSETVTPDIPSDSIQPEDSNNKVQHEVPSDTEHLEDKGYGFESVSNPVKVTPTNYRSVAEVTAQVAVAAKAEGTYSRVAKAQTARLPQTGDKDSLLASFIGMIMLGLGFSLSGKYRKRY